MAHQTATLDGNTAVAHIAYRVNEVCAIYPITPSSVMAELADQWAGEGLSNIWGTVPVVQQMQSEGGAAGTVHGALQSGALTTTFTASQGLLLMLPNMFKIAGELTPTVFHVAARAVATQALSIFGDHSDVMAARTTGFAMLSSASVQEAHDNALIAQAATLESRIPFLHFFDGFRISHEINTVELIADDTIRAMIDDKWVRAHRQRALNPENPFIRGTAHNPDTFFQARESANPFYASVPAITQKYMDQFAKLTGRHYHLVDYSGAADAEQIIVAMGCGATTARETVKSLNATHHTKFGIIQVRLFRPFPVEAFIAALPKSVKKIAVIDQTKEPGATGEPLYLDVVTAISQAYSIGSLSLMPKIIGGRYGLSSKDFQPAHVKAIFDELAQPTPKNGFTVGILDDVTHSSIQEDVNFSIDPPDVVSAV
ncbi:MAG TPA: pyruvate:ferredoxin (flavodoxin) oxidoreductase, partial [Pseudomonadales bacterium]|nr:pyruvate:ferredoxin (flavodoxin) oxidoreductase [Pseudomonadales bacterium]